MNGSSSTLLEALAAIERQYRECQESPDSLERVIGPIVNDQSDPEAEWGCPTCGEHWFSSEPNLIYTLGPSGPIGRVGANKLNTKGPKPC